MTPIGYFHCPQVNPYEAPRQGVLQTSGNEAEGYVELLGGQNYEQALEGLETFSHVWLVYSFHHNSTWKPKVLPPRGSDKKIGVFATRSPYRPNPIGISCVRLKKIEGRKIYVNDFDLLDGSPILDVKPYLAYADSFPEANEGWIQSRDFQIEILPGAQEQIEFLKAHGVTEILGFIYNQLQTEPTNSRKKRILAPPVAFPESFFVLAYRTWRILFFVEESTVRVESIFSGYSTEDLEQSSDPYADKNVHRMFLANYEKSPSLRR
jgi:tRNA-Thr(GGU) m(6)t(6)A37 methyltransferase TsaA